MSGSCILGLDCGTQSAKAGIWTLEGEAVGRGSCPLELSSPEEGWAEQDPRQWWQSACAAIRAACAGVDVRRIGALGVAWQRESFTLVDRGGEPLRPAMLWLDIRAHEEAAELAGEAASLLDLTGKPVDVTLTLPRIAWLRKHEPRLFDPAPRWVDVGCWLFERLTGRRASCLAGVDTAGMVDLGSRDWCEQVLSRAGLAREQLPELVEPGAVVGALSARGAEETGLPEGVPVVAAGGDGQVFAAGLLGGRPGCTLTLGTSVVLGIPVSGAPVSPLYRTLFAALPEKSYLLEAVVQSGSYLFRWLEGTFAARPSLPAWEAVARGIPPGAGGLVTVPHWWGTRFPGPAPEARGATIGWANHHTEAHLYRSLLEGIAFELRHLLAAIAARGIEPAGTLTVGGGGASSELFRAVIRDSLGMAIRMPREPEPVARGAAMLAALGAGRFPGLAEARGFLPACDVELPDPEHHARYGRIYEEVYVPLRERSVELTVALSRLARG